MYLPKNKPNQDKFPWKTQRSWLPGSQLVPGGLQQVPLDLENQLDPIRWCRCCDMDLIWVRKNRNLIGSQ